MKLLFDTDAFCKLGIAGLLADAAGVFGADLSDCGRLAALPYMLRRGRLLRRYGRDACSALIPLAEKMPVCPQPHDSSVEPFALNEAIDPGEVQLFSAAAEFDLMVISGDKRAIRALKHVTAVRAALAGRIVVLEGILLTLCEQLGPEGLRRRVAPLSAHDTAIAVCFSPGSSDSRDALRSYYESVVAGVHPFLLWNPEARREI